MLRIAALLLLTLALASCGGGHNIYVEEPGHDPGDAALVDSVVAFLKITGAPVSSQYEFTRVDLNADKRRDALVMLKNPYGHWCDFNGCTMMIFRANDDSFSIVNQVRPVRGPLYISDARTNGWRDIVMRVDGRWTRTKDVALQFDGTRYPADPAAVPATYRYANGKTGQRVFP